MDTNLKDIVSTSIVNNLNFASRHSQPKHADHLVANAVPVASLLVLPVVVVSAVVVAVANT